MMKYHLTNLLLTTGQFLVMIIKHMGKQLNIIWEIDWKTDMAGIQMVDDSCCENAGKRD